MTPQEFDRCRETAARVLAAVLILSVTLAIAAGPRLLAWAIEATAR